MNASLGCIVGLALLAFTLSSTADADEVRSSAPLAIQLLGERSRTAFSISADLEITTSTGEEWAEYAAARQRSANRLAADSGDAATAEKMRLTAAMDGQPIPTITRRYRYVMDSQGRLLMEEIRNGAPSINKSVGWSFLDGRWVRYTPNPLINRNPSFTVPPAPVQEEFGYQVPEVAVFLGDGVPTEPYTYWSDKLFPQNSIRRGYLTWSDFLQAPGITATIEPTEQMSQVLVQILAPVEPSVELSPYRLRVWLDPALGHAVTRFEAGDPQKDPSTGEVHFEPNTLLEFSHPIERDEGPALFTECTVTYFDSASDPVPDLPMKRWPCRCYAVRTKRVKFSNVRVNEPLDANLFDIKLREKTGILDEIPLMPIIDYNAAREGRVAGSRAGIGGAAPIPWTFAGIAPLFIPALAVIALVAACAWAWVEARQIVRTRRR